MSEMVDHVNIEIPCEHCGSKTKKTVGWLKTHNQLFCTCGVSTALSVDQFKEQIAKAEESVTALQQTVKNLGKYTKKSDASPDRNS